MERHELTEQEWNQMKEMLPEEQPTRRGRPYKPHRLILNGILWILKAGAPWRDLPERFGPWKTVYNRFRRWQQDRTWDRLMSELLDRLDEHGQIDRELWCIDGSVIRAHHCASGARRVPVDPQEPADHALGRSQGGYGTKMHLLSDGQGLPLAVTATPGQCHESTQFEAVMTASPLLIDHTDESSVDDAHWPTALAGDKAYGANRIREWLAHRHIEDVIPTKSNETPNEAFDRDAYRGRNIVERVIGWLKECRRVATRYEKNALHFLAMVKLAIIRHLLKSDLRDTA